MYANYAGDDVWNASLELLWHIPLVGASEPLDYFDEPHGYVYVVARVFGPRLMRLPGVLFVRCMIRSAYEFCLKQWVACFGTRQLRRTTNCSGADRMWVIV